MTDVVIIGGGPAGVSAALTAMHRGKTALIVSSPPEDSPLWKAEHIDNYPGLPGVTGRELLQKLLLHNGRPVNLDLALIYSSKEELSYKTISNAVRRILETVAEHL